MAKVQFDGTTKLIHVLPGVTDINVQIDLYGYWKNWVIFNDNAKYEQAFRTFGGDPTAGGQVAPQYFFLTNGWRVHIDGNDTLFVDIALNLYTNEGDTPFILINGSHVNSTRSDVPVVNFSPSIIAAEVWEHDTRTLTSGSSSGDVNVVSINGIPVSSPEDLGAQMAPGILNTPVTTFTAEDTIGEAIWRARFIPKAIYVNTDADENGDGTQQYPFNNINDAKDFIEDSGINNIFVSGSVVVPRNLKNMNIYGIGLPTIDFNGQDVKNSKFTQIKLSGAYSSNIIAEECHLTDGFELAGHFHNCELHGNVTARPNSEIILLTCLSGIPGIGRPTLSMNSGQASAVSIRGQRGGLTIFDCDHVDDVITVEIAEGSLTFDSSCTNGIMVARGDCKFVDESNGATVHDETTQNLISKEAANTRNTVIAMS